VWGLAVLGGLQDLQPRSEARILSVVIYVVMGWMVLVAIVPLFRALGPGGFAWVAPDGPMGPVACPLARGVLIRGCRHTRPDS